MQTTNNENDNRSAKNKTNFAKLARQGCIDTVVNELIRQQDSALYGRLPHRSMLDAINSLLQNGIDVDRNYIYHRIKVLRKKIML
jgi:hypothetical protein